VGVGGLTISYNASLTNLDGLSALTSVVYLSIVWNSSLTSLDGLSNLAHVDKILTIAVYDNFDDSCTPVPDNCP
jgi:hypothetical protein